MRCKNCNGELLIKDGVWTCKNCGSKFSIQEYNEGTEVYLCYLENDENGRRTKESSIAQEIYHILEEKKISTFCSRISLEDVTGTIAQSIDQLALENAKLILIIATSKENYSLLWERNKEKLEGKKIIPVYMGMNAYDIPKEINSIQALKYDNVGASEDLVSSVLKILGKTFGKEDNYNSLNQKQNKKKYILFASVIGLLIVVGIILIIINKYNSLNSESSNSIEQSLDLNDDELYKNATSLIEEERYAEAISILSGLGDYNDSETLLHTCYMKYAGYYYDEASALYFRLQIFDKNNGSIEAYQTNDEGEKCTITESVSFEGNIADVSYLDSKGNTGNINLELKNDEIVFNVVPSEINSEIYISEKQIELFIAEKSDQPIKKTISLDYLESILDGETTIDEIQKDGYDISYSEDFMVWSIYTDVQCVAGAIYRFDDTDIRLYVFDYDVTKYDFWDLDKETLETPIVRAIQAPANIVSNDYIGTIAVPYIKDSYIFYPDSKIDVDNGFSLMSNVDYLNEFDLKEFEDESLVTFCSLDSIGEDNYNSLLFDSIVIDKTERLFIEETSCEYAAANIISEDEDKYLVMVSDGGDYWTESGLISNSVTQTKYYYVYKDTYGIEESDNQITYGSIDEAEKICGSYLTYHFDELDWKTGEIVNYTLWFEASLDGDKLNYYMYADSWDTGQKLEEYSGYLIYIGNNTFETSDGIFKITANESSISISTYGTGSYLNGELTGIY